MCGDNAKLIGCHVCYLGLLLAIDGCIGRLFNFSCTFCMEIFVDIHGMGYQYLFMQNTFLYSLFKIIVKIFQLDYCHLCHTVSFLFQCHANLIQLPGFI